MQSRFVLVPNQSLGYERSGLVSRVAGAVAFFIIGAVVATELYPQIAPDRHAEYGTAWDSHQVVSPAFEAVSDRAGTSRDIAEYTGGPIPQMSFPPTQPAAATKETQAAANEDRSASAVAVDKSRLMENKSGYKKRTSRRSNGNTQGRPNWEQPSYWAVAKSWNSWGTYQGGSDFGPRPGRGIQPDRRGQFVVWR